MRIAALAVTAMAASWAVAASAQETPHPLLGAALACDREADRDARLRCYEAAMGPIRAGVDAGTLIMIEPRRVRRSFFGLGVPAFLRGSRDDDGEELRQIDTIVRAARASGYDLVVDLEEGGTWQTTEGRAGSWLPRPGAEVRVTRGVAGYFLRFSSGRMYRARRIG